MDGQKEVLGMWVGENESAKFWLSVLNSIKARGVEDILIACIDGLTGFTNAIEAVYPKTEIQQCIIHQIRNTTKFDIKALMADLKKVYATVALIQFFASTLLQKASGLPYSPFFPCLAIFLHRSQDSPHPFLIFERSGAALWSP